MTWVKIDDRLPRHPKMIGLNVNAKWAFIETLCYCAEYLTDGSFPRGLIGGRELAALVHAGLVEQFDDGFLVHDYLEYNPTRSDVEGSREQARERMRDVRANVHPNVDANFERSSPTSSPNPVPVPQPLTTRSKYSRAFEAFWTAYPRHVGKRTAATAFERASTRADPRVITEGAACLAADPNLPEARFIPHPTTWLNRDGWEDAPMPSQNGSKPINDKKAGVRELISELKERGL